MTDKGEKDKKVDLGLLEEDDEFEEFPAEGEESSSSFFSSWISNFFISLNESWVKEEKKKHLKSTQIP